MDNISTILETISPYIQQMVEAGDKSLQYFQDESGKNYLAETMGKYVADFNQANKGAMDTTYRQVKARGGDTDLNSASMIQREFQTALGRAQAAQMGRRQEKGREDTIKGNLLEAGQKAQDLAGNIGSTAYVAEKGLEGDKVRAAATSSAAAASAAASRYSADKRYDLGVYQTDKDFDLGVYGTDKEYDLGKYGIDVEADTWADRIQADSLVNLGSGVYSHFDPESNQFATTNYGTQPPAGFTTEDQINDWYNTQSAIAEDREDNTWSFTGWDTDTAISTAWDSEIDTQEPEPEPEPENPNPWTPDNK